MPSGRDPGKEFQLSDKIGIRFSLSGDLRFLSHQDMLYLFARAIRRAQLPILHTQGYNPRPKLWLLLPKPLGVGCLDDLLLVELRDDCTSEQFADRLDPSLPPGIKLHASFKLGPARSPQPRAAAYSLELSRQDAAEVAPKIPSLLETHELTVNRLAKRNGQSRQVNIRPYLSSIQLNVTELCFTLAYSPAGSAKPAEVLALLDLDNPSNRAKLVRTETIYAGLPTSPPDSKTTSRKTLGRAYHCFSSN